MTEEEKVLSYIVSGGLSQGQQILIFCPSKINCAQTCASIIELLCPEYREYGEYGLSRKVFAHPSSMSTTSASSSNGNNNNKNNNNVSNSSSNSSCSNSSNRKEDSGGSGIGGRAGDNKTDSESTVMGLDTAQETVKKAADGYMDNGRPFCSHQRYTASIPDDTHDKHTTHNARDATRTIAQDLQVQKEKLKKSILSDRHSTISDILSSAPLSDPQLLRFISSGFAFHHAGLGMDERGAVELAFRTGELW